MKLNLTLAEDFDPWWKLKKYQDHDIEAKQYSQVQIKMRHGSNSGWPGEQRDVEYWVELANGKAVGFRHGRSSTGIRRSKFAEFPVTDMEKI
jgi:hypothetical protein